MNIFSKVSNLFFFWYMSTIFITVSFLIFWSAILCFNIKGSKLTKNKSRNPLTSKSGLILSNKYSNSLISIQNSIHILIHLFNISSAFSCLVFSKLIFVLFTEYCIIAPFKILATFFFLSFSSIGIPAKVIFLPW